MSYYYYTPPPSLYFVEEILKSSEKGLPDNIILLDAREAESTGQSNVFSTIQVEANQFQFSEGNYIFHTKNEGYSNGNSDAIAKRNLFLNNRYRSLIARRVKRNSEEKPAFSANTRIYSYHVNVGHGNCSIIVLDTEGVIKIWMIDCSNHDFISGNWHQSDIEYCFDYIKSRFRISEIKLEKFFLTHSHYDHYSGVETLIRKNNIDSGTTFYLNIYYSMPSKKYNNLLQRINTLKCPIIHPQCCSSSTDIDFWYPDTILLRSSPKVAPPSTYKIESNVNNSSAVFKLTFGQKSMLFTGDIEDGWNSITRCPKHLSDVNYFIVSHHGSINGHKRTTCPLGLKISNVGNCKSPSTNSIIMGRDKAYPGIYSPQVIKDLSSNLVFTEYDHAKSAATFLQIDWTTDFMSWH